MQIMIDQKTISCNGGDNALDDSGSDGSNEMLATMIAATLLVIIMTVVISR